VSGSAFIGGVWRQGSGERFVSTDPATGETVWEGAAASAEDCAAAMAAARAALPVWADRPLEERVAVLRCYAAVLKERTPVLAEAISRETGKALWETTAELGSMIGKVEISIRAQAERAGGREAATAFGRAVLRHRPHGVAAVLGPYNFPGHLPNGHVVPALLAGDTVVFKPSELTPHAGELMVRALQEAGVPAGAVNLVQGARDTGQALLAQGIDALLFTGSAGAGAAFRRAFADRPEVVLALELGGNNPLIVWDAEDAEAAAGIVVQSAFVTTGQRCSCARRLILPEGVAGDRVLAALEALSGRLRFGPWSGAEEPFAGPLIGERAASGAAAQVEALIDRGARVLFRGSAPDGPAWFAPVALDATGVDTPDDEIFAPVLQVRRAATFDEAVRLANATRYGLAAGLLSDDAERWRRFLNRSRAGVVNWNRPTTGAAGDMPFGGLNASGNHRPSAYYAADYAAYPVASFEADRVASTVSEIRGLRA